MDRTVLVEQSINAGEKLVKLLDESGFPPTTAYWEPNSSGIWKLRLFSFNYIKLGSRKIYAAIQNIISKDDSISKFISLEDIGLVDPFDQTRIALNNMMTTGMSIIGARMINNRVDNFTIEDVYLYRSNY